MRKNIFILLICFCGVSVYSQIDAKHYIEMRNHIVDSLSIDNAYVSDTLREHETLAHSLYEMGIRDSLPLYNPYEVLHTEYSEILHSTFQTIVDIYQDDLVNKNLIYFSFLEDSYISVYAYLGIMATDYKYIYPFPMWGHYNEWYEFLFQIKGDSIVLLRKDQIYE